MPAANRLLNISTPLGEENTVLMGMVGHEALGRLPVYRLALASTRARVKASELLGKNITIGLENSDGKSLRYFNGYVTEFAQAGTSAASWFEDGEDHNAYKYELVVHPWLWFLTRSSNCRIFQHQSVPDIVKAVCGVYPVALLDTGSLTANYAVKEYVCQYRESDYNFILRLMEHEGIYFSFVHENGKHTMRLFDSYGAHAPTPGKTTSVLGTYAEDTKNIIQQQLNYPKSLDYLEPKPGSYNLLNTPDDLYRELGPDRYWTEVNEPFLAAAVERGDKIYVATRPTRAALVNAENAENADGLSGFGREYKFLRDRGYVYDFETGQLLLKGGER